MSELTRCNYCSLQDMKRRAEKRGVTVILGRDRGWVTAKYSNEDKASHHYLELTESCAC